ncbi:Mitogen-activated protein kinase [Plasmodiophora brassicae]|nr:MAPK5 [Plasmodiophora brassicae]CEO96945.1 hypothetical protein PBRA_005549 [Plasmodiophora brassicae]
MGEHIDAHVLRKYQTIEKIGKGAYGIVWKAIDRRSRKTMAVKKIFDAFRNATDAQRTFREIMYLQELGEHPNIIRMTDVMKAENDLDIYVVFEFLDLDLHAVIKANILEEVHKKYIIYQSLKALKYLHSGELLHRDMKPSNILINSECHVKLCDFGLARSVSSISNDGPHVLTEYVATRWYRAPEILLGSNYYTKGVDMWSIGCILAEMLGGKPLFPGSSTLNQLERIIQVIGMPSQDDLDAIGSEFAQTMLETMNVPQERTKWEDLFPGANPLALDLIDRLLQFNPNKRLSARQAIMHPYLGEFQGSEDEMTLDRVIAIKIDDNRKYTVADYRGSLYDAIRARKKELVNAKRVVKRRPRLAKTPTPSSYVRKKPSSSSSSSAPNVKPRAAAK